MFWYYISVFSFYSITHARSRFKERHCVDPLGGTSRSSRMPQISIVQECITRLRQWFAFDKWSNCSGKSSSLDIAEDQVSRMRTRSRAVSPVRFSLFRLPSLRYPPRRKDGARARERAARRRRREDWRLESEEDGISRVRASRLVVRAEQRKRESGKSGERRTRWTRGCRRLHGNEARRECDGNHGSRGFLSRADLSVPLSGLSSSSFSSSGPLPSAHGASKRPRGRRSSRADL